MDRRDLRLKAKQQIKGRRGFLLAVLLTSALPSVLYSTIVRMANLTPPRALGWAISILCALLHLGALKITLEETEKEKTGWDSLGFVFQRGIFLNALLFVVAVSLVTQVINLVGTSFGTGGILLSLLLGVILDLFLFPMYYGLVLHPEKPLTAQIRDGFALALGECGGIFLYHFWLYLPVVLGYVCALLLGVIGIMSFYSITALIILMTVGIAALGWYMPYVLLAQAMYAKVLIEGGDEPPSPPPVVKRHMKLVKKDGYYKVPLAGGEGRRLTGKEK